MVKCKECGAEVPKYTYDLGMMKRMNVFKSSPSTNYCTRCGSVKLVGIQNSVLSVTRSDHKNRESRLERNVKTLYHRTDSHTIIITTQTMKRGDERCSAGSGIYFALSADATYRKTTHHSFSNAKVLQCKVRLGRVKTVAKYDKSVSNMTFTKLLKSGFDSIMLTFFNGAEYVVYNYDQVKSISLYKE